MKKTTYLTLLLGFIFSNLAADEYKSDQLKFQPPKTPTVQVKTESEVDKGHWLEIPDTSGPRDIASEKDSSQRGPSSSLKVEASKSDKGLKHWDHSQESEVWPETKYWQFKKKPL